MKKGEIYDEENKENVIVNVNDMDIDIEENEMDKNTSIKDTTIDNEEQIQIHN